MSHSICGIVLAGAYDEAAALRYDLRPVPLRHGVTLFHIDHYFSACWQHRLGLEGSLEGPPPGHGLLPRERAVAVLVSEITGEAEPLFALIITEYFGGVGEQDARVYRGRRAADPSVTRINSALAYLGVVAGRGMDEFDTVGLGRHRAQPGYLERYAELAEELGV
jgi:hypothetical protein